MPLDPVTGQWIEPEDENDSGDQGAGDGDDAGAPEIVTKQELGEMLNQHSAQLLESVRTIVSESSATPKSEDDADSEAKGSFSDWDSSRESFDDYLIRKNREAHEQVIRQEREVKQTTDSTVKALLIAARAERRNEIDEIVEATMAQAIPRLDPAFQNLILNDEEARSEFFDTVIGRVLVERNRRNAQAHSERSSGAQGGKPGALNEQQDAAFKLAKKYGPQGLTQEQFLRTESDNGITSKGGY